MTDWAHDMHMMHHKFGVKHWVEKNKDNKELMETYLRFRLDMCQEELTETKDAVDAKDPEEVVDGLIDLMVFALGTLDILGVDADMAWTLISVPS